MSIKHNSQSLPSVKHSQERQEFLRLVRQAQLLAKRNHTASQELLAVIGGTDSMPEKPAPKHN